jgi:hypothetical protein
MAPAAEQARSETMTLMNTFMVYIQHVREARERARTERLVSELPPEIRKDIGWPGSFPSRRIGGSGPARL